MNVKILYNNESSDQDAASRLGFSCVIDRGVLFDTGPDGEELKRNFDKLRIDAGLLEAVVISHDHWDHVGGLEYIIEKNKKIKIYICPGFEASFKNHVFEFSKNVIKADNFQRVCSYIYTTGQLTGFYKDKTIAEQALILQTDKGFSVITGCAHPGIIKMLKRVKSQLSLSEFYAVIGGFHLRDHSYADAKKIVDEFACLKVKNVAPLHCTGPEAVKAFQDVYHDKCHILNRGDKIEV